MESQKDLQYYLSLPYTFQVRRNEEDGEVRYWASVKELDGCHTPAKSYEEAIQELQTVLEMYIETKLEHGDPIPEPVDNEYSGKFVVRLPKTLHKHLALMAEEEGVSLNQYALYKLTR
ncbi:type II toxin-antitoxin system HicB family antitoxin [Cytobacillus praedii]|uniref:Type II toxin-antitoxin system HicB family antitoxin n=1 Tax=Cytobacillus praedii TaxID=1742358 RepID=A0A4R1ANZ8_9BACI|nr:type II toxin-antitoxin system HicB family antitoxin [Cytobacillus praedii]TCJ01588.1 type II toxin-antitoxin system HicB family antitoxin [Cytobacillus praedii]